MEPEFLGPQDVFRCHICKTPGPRLHCDICDIHLCKDCVEKHLSEEFTEHKIVTFKKREPTAICPKHSSKECELYCEPCDLPICVHCVSSGEHEGHNIVGILKSFEAKKEVIQRDLAELEEFIYPKYKDIASGIPIQKDDFSMNSTKIAIGIAKHGQDLHREIDNIIEKMNFDLNQMNFNILSILDKQEYEIAFTIYEITQSIAGLKNLQNSNDVRLVSAYKSRNAEFKRLPPKLIVPFKRFTPEMINKEQLCQQFGSLPALSIKTEENGYSMDSPGAESSPPDRPLIEVPRIIKVIDTLYNCLNSVSCLSDEYIWTCGDDKIMKLYNLQGELVYSIDSRSKTYPKDIAVTRSGNLVYIPDDRPVRIVKNTQTQLELRLHEWKPCSVCSTFSGSLLVVMDHDNYEQTKVVCYSGHRDQQSIQYNEKLQPLYSYGYYKYISGNRNQDICVSDYRAHAVVVVNQTGKLRFTYTGPPSTNGSFNPLGITTDSQGRILTVDCENKLIHILDQDGQFLRYIDNCGLLNPFNLCVDTRDNLFVAERHTAQVKKIQYCQ